MTESWIITIDGPAGVGKSTVAKMLAARLDAVFLDTGATYRAVTLAAIRQGVDLQSVTSLLELMGRTDFQFAHDGDLLKVTIDGVDGTVQIRDPEITEQVRHIASQPALRERLVELQRDFAGQFDKVVAEGRDQGTVVFPDAKWKFFLTADAVERAKRRQGDLEQNGKSIDLETLQQQIESRDASDMNRSVGPLKPAVDAIHIDTTNLNTEQVVQAMLNAVEGPTHA